MAEDYATREQALADAVIEGRGKVRLPAGGTYVGRNWMPKYLWVGSLDEARRTLDDLVTEGQGGRDRLITLRGVMRDLDPAWPTIAEKRWAERVQETYHVHMRNAVAALDSTTWMKKRIEAALALVEYGP